MRIVSLLVLAVLAMVTAGCSSRETAEREAREYLGALYPGHAIVVTCQDYDTDNNEYVSCTAVVDNRPLGLECAARFTFNSSCRLRTIGIAP